jgi:hypothetical protein
VSYIKIHAFIALFLNFVIILSFRHGDNLNRRNPLGSLEQNNSQQPGAGESQNTSSTPFHAQGSQPPRVGHTRKARVQQNRYAVPSTMHYSESSQAEAGQQIDRLRQTNQPVPSALFNESPEMASNPSNSQNVPLVSNEGGNDPMVMASGNNDDFLQQFANGQQDSAQPGVPATNNPANNDDDNQDSENEHAMESHDDDLQRDEAVEEDKEEELGPNEEAKCYVNSQNSDSDGKKGKNRTENPNRPNHQEESNSDAKEDEPYESRSIRQNEQFSPAEKGFPGLEKVKKFNAGSRKPSNGPATGQPFGYSIGEKKSGNYATFVVPSSFMDSPPYMSQNTRDGSQYSSSYIKDR